MQKRKKINLRALTIGAMMAALSIILERLLPITPASNALDFRITLSNIPIILTSLTVSPIIGAVCGVVSDIAGCFISGYAPFPLLTAAPLFTGLLPGLVIKLFGKNEKIFLWKTAAALGITHIVSSLIITTYGLCVMRGTPFMPLLQFRLPFCFASFVIDTVLVYILIKSPLSKLIRNGEKR